MMPNLSDVINLLEKIVPRKLAENWDNVGLQVGRFDWPIEKIRIALDPDIEVIKMACREGINLLVTHHPLFFKPIKAIDFGSPIGKALHTAFNHQLSICIMILFAFKNNIIYELEIINICVVIGLFYLFKFMKNQLNNQKSKLKLLIKWKFHHLVLAVLFGLWFGEVGIFTSIVFTILGIQLVIKILKHFENYTEINAC